MQYDLVNDINTLLPLMSKSQLEQILAAVEQEIARQKQHEESYDRIAELSANMTYDQLVGRR